MIRPVRRLVLAFVVALIVVGVGAASPTGLADDGEPRGRRVLTAPGESLRAGDRVTVAVFGHPELSSSTVVSHAGTMTVPFVGSLRAADRTTEELAATIREALRDGFQMRAPRVFVGVDASAASTVYILGEVEASGAHSFESARGLTLMQLLALAGGITEDADAAHVRLHRTAGRPEGDAIDLTVGSPASDPIALLRLRDGDTVFVPRSPRISVLGQVSSPAAFPAVAGAPLTLVRAIAHAGGFDEKADRKRVVWISGSGEGRRVRTVDVTAILAGGADDPVLAPGDVVHVRSLEW